MVSVDDAPRWLVERQPARLKRRAYPPRAKGEFTRSELQAEWRVSHATAQENINLLILDGRLARRKAALNGQPVYVYRWL